MSLHPHSVRDRFFLTSPLLFLEPPSHQKFRSLEIPGAPTASETTTESVETDTHSTQPETPNSTSLPTDPFFLTSSLETKPAGRTNSTSVVNQSDNDKQKTLFGKRKDEKDKEKGKKGKGKLKNFLDKL